MLFTQGEREVPFLCWVLGVKLATIEGTTKAEQIAGSDTPGLGNEALFDGEQIEAGVEGLSLGVLMSPGAYQ